VCDAFVYIVHSERNLRAGKIALSGEDEPHYESGPLSLSFVMSVMSVSCNDTIQLSLSGLPSQRYCQLLEVRKNEPFEVIHNDLAAFFLCYVCGGPPSAMTCSVSTLSIRPAVALSGLSIFVFELVCRTESSSSSSAAVTSLQSSSLLMVFVAIFGAEVISSVASVARTPFGLEA
jgi:hypothetical protein